MPAFKPIQLIPPGLLGLFQLKDMGRGIVELPDVLQGVMELRDWYFEARAEQSQLTHGIVANGPAAQFTAFAPNDIAPGAREWWWVHEYTIFVQGADPVVDQIIVWPAFVPTPVGTLRPNALADSRLITGTGAVTARGFFLPAGASLGFGHGQSTPLISYSGFVRFTRLPV